MINIKYPILKYNDYLVRIQVSILKIANPGQDDRGR